MKAARQNPERDSKPAPHRAVPSAAWGTPERPWLGLTRFTEHEKEYFYGRDAEITELRDRVLRAALTVLYGVSGYGKSSLLGAGLIPALRAERLLPILLSRFSFDDPKRPPIARAIEEIHRVLPASDSAPQSPSSNYQSDSLWEFFHDRSLPWWQPNNPVSVHPVLIFDQFEDIFTQGEDKGGERTASACEFLIAIADLVENRPPAGLRERMRKDRALVRSYDFQSRPVKVVIALREDFLARLERWRRVLPSVVENRVELRLLSGGQALRAVLEPSRKRHGKPPIVSEATGAAIVRFVAGVEPDVPLEEIHNVPPLLSLICAQLNERRFSSSQAETPERDDIPIDWVRASKSADEAHAAGIVNISEPPRTAAEEVLQNFYNESFAEHSPAVRRFVEDKLVSEAGFRETVTLDTALTELRAAEVADPGLSLDRLVDQRLLVIEERGGVTRVEFTHDILAALALRSRESRKEKEALAAKKAAEIARAEEERRRNEAERLRERAMFARRRARQLALVASVVALVAIGTLFYAFSARQETERQRAETERQRAVAVELKEQALAEKANAEKERANAENERAKADEQRQTAQAALKLAEQREAEAKAAEESKNQLLLKGISDRLCTVLAGNDPDATKDFWAPRLVYYHWGPVNRDLVIKQHRHDARYHPFRNYTVTTTPTVSAVPETGEWIIKFGMNYTLLDPQRRPSTGELAITLRVDRNYRVTQISQEVIKARKQ